ncbi:chlorophyll synthesis pathway protein BchC [Hydrogenophaga sp. PBL-H3]|uniref:chlorophyll synthesis pathway protein BchC n=1 Tax=Hydrogenophaga sp. PBL-H3 TaxID=434010 RepID=UPI0013200B9C|nr:chlorophyll synthesis pathway protein BchC [Hydrogenophaga sp. PBL-H3]QHE76839.1 chlorophyll synthesis pathway protein BchC [Hydrogenophaga sp. PBL-H3]QHE81263.1 chlorophyll synthesis pathway protein BchC [Hydrogenophaga sp. PBL-H3]
MQAQAIVFQSPCNLSVRTLELRGLTDGDLEVEIEYSGISTGTERLLWDGSMPPFPGMGYPLVPGYETVGRVVRTQGECGHGQARIQTGDQVFVPGSYSFEGVHNLFGGAGSRLVVSHDRVVKLHNDMGSQMVLLALAATAYHSVTFGGSRAPATPPDLIIGHGVMGRLLARLTVAAGAPAPVVWETQAARRVGAEGYSVISPEEDTRKDYRAIYDVSGDADILNKVIPRLAKGGEVVLAGFYKKDISFAFAPAFMREAQIRAAAEWKRADLVAVTQLVQTGRLNLDGLITHTETPARASDAYAAAFGDPQCLKMVLDWRN